MIVPASQAERLRLRLADQAKAGAAKVTVTVSGDPSPVCRKALEEVGRQVLRANGLRHGRFGFGLGGGLW